LADACSATAATVGGKTVVTLSGFSGTQTSAGSLIDGRYTLTALASQITTATGQQLDGNGDGTPGDDFVFADSGTTTGNQLYRLYGDANGDRTVNAADLATYDDPHEYAVGVSTGRQRNRRD